jgi:hypothetical protein
MLLVTYASVCHFPCRELRFHKQLSANKNIMTRLLGMPRGWIVLQMKKKVHFLNFKWLEFG